MQMFKIHLIQHDVGWSAIVDEHKVEGPVMEEEAIAWISQQDRKIEPLAAENAEEAIDGILTWIKNKVTSKAAVT